MIIANPLYDSTFKYLMEDLGIAKTLISTIIQQEVEVISFLPQEYVLEHKPLPFLLHRLDFAATIRDETGNKKEVVIEIQKAKFPEDVLRFRRYLGKQYRSSAEALPIITIYLLGFRLEELNHLAVKISRSYIDLITHQTIGNIVSPFVEALTHDSYVLHIARLPQKPGPNRSELEVLLDLFNQAYIVSAEEEEQRRLLMIDEEQISPKYREMVRRLVQAAADPALREKLEEEEAFEKAMEREERKMAAMNDMLIATTQQVELERQRAEAERKRTEVKEALLVEERQRAEAERQKAREQAIECGRLMKSLGATTEQIKKATGLTEEGIKRL